MRFRYPGTENYFDLPSEWWDEAGMRNFEPSAPSFRCDPSPLNWPVATISLSCIRVPIRNLGVAPFERDRMIQILSGIRSSVAIPPVEVMDRRDGDSLILRDGYHRFHASIATGLSFIPAVVLPFWEPEVPSKKMALPS